MLNAILRLHCCSKIHTGMFIYKHRINVLKYQSLTALEIKFFILLGTPSQHFEEGLGLEILCSFSLLLKYDTNFVVGAIKSQGGYLCQKVYIMVVVLVMDIHFMSI